ncbi:MAG: hypothetical protein BWK73_07945 [Thiothrix lacustris]|uniref:Uncharacterized protein n=1 Tax=Thiothrix lacustris TaxID=525917 RepID=A0A1Y1QVP3_9GAMM|nr:MAG: hypothetical protein BWK73_07945 [Thiothrix lacustris]
MTNDALWLPLSEANGLLGGIKLDVYILPYHGCNRLDDYADEISVVKNIHHRVSVHVLFFVINSNLSGLII